MKELVIFLSQFPSFVLVLILLMEISLIVLFFQFIFEDGNVQKIHVAGGSVAQINNEEYKAVFKVIEKRLNELAVRCDMHEKRILQLESQAVGRDGSTPSGLEHKVNELQRLVSSVADKIKEYQ